MEYLIFEVGIPLGVLLLLHFVIGKYPAPLPESKDRRREILEALVLWAILAIVFVIQVLLTPESALAAPTPKDTVTGLLVQLLPFVVIPLLYVLLVNKWTAKDLGFTMPRAPSVTIFALLVFGFFGALPLFFGPAREPIAVPFLLLALYQPSFTEEFFFRGIIQGKLERALGQNRAWFFSALLFGLLHIFTLIFVGGLDIVGGVFYLVQVTISGCIFGIIYMKTRSLLPSMVAHYLTSWRLGSILALIFS